VSMLQLLSCGETVEHLREEIGDSSDFRKEVLAHFDDLVRENKVAEVVSRAKERSAKLAAITNARQARRQRKYSKQSRPKILTEERCQRIRAMFAEGGYSRAEIGRRFLVSTTSIARVLEAEP
jgi:hypothetical protein